MSELLKVLYVEDDADIRMVAEMTLEDEGFELIICSSGQEALDKAVDQRLDLLLLDVMMPGMDGPTALQKLRELPQLATTPAIFMTAKVQPAEVAQYKAIGAAGVINKPFDPMTLAEEIHTILGRGHG